jgi:hypothetical protein
MRVRRQRALRLGLLAHLQILLCGRRFDLRGWHQPGKHRFPPNVYTLTRQQAATAQQ